MRTLRSKKPAEPQPDKLPKGAIRVCVSDVEWWAKNGVPCMRQAHDKIRNYRNSGKPVKELIWLPDASLQFVFEHAA